MATPSRVITPYHTNRQQGLPQVYNQMASRISARRGTEYGTPSPYRQALTRPRDMLLIGEDLDTGQPYRFPLHEWRTHWQIVGAPATGKTSLEELVIRQLIMQKKPVFVIDPLGPLYYRLLNWLSWHPSLRKNVIFFNPGGTGEFYPGVNPFRKVDYMDDVAVQAFRVADAILKVWGNEAEDAPELTKNILDMADPLISGGYSFIETPYFTELGKSPIRQKLAALSHDPTVKRALLNMDNLPMGRQREMLRSLINRVHRFTRPKAMKMILGATQNVWDFEEIVEGQKTVICCLAPKRGLLHQQHGYLLGVLLINEIVNYVRERSLDQAAKRPFYVFIDEIENLLTPDIADILDQLRNYGLRMILAHQRLGQLIRESPDLWDAVSVDARVRAVFGGVSPESLDQSLGDLMYLGEYDLRSVKQEIWHPMTIDHVEEPVTATHKVSSWSNSDSWGFGSGSGSSASLSSLLGGDGPIQSILSSMVSSSDMSTMGSSAGGAEGISESTRLRSVIAPLLASRQYWGLEELRHMAQAQLFKQEPQHMTFRNLTEPPKRIRVANIREYPWNPDGQIEMIEASIRNHPKFYNRGSDVLEEIELRRQGLEDQPEREELDTAGDTKAPVFRTRPTQKNARAASKPAPVIEPPVAPPQGAKRGRKRKVPLVQRVEQAYGVLHDLDSLQESELTRLDAVQQRIQPRQAMPDAQALRSLLIEAAQEIIRDVGHMPGKEGVGVFLERYLEGKQVLEIAQELGVSREWCSRNYRREAVRLAAMQFISRNG